jgi:hypothetical protein
MRLSFEVMLAHVEVTAQDALCRFVVDAQHLCDRLLREDSIAFDPRTGSLGFSMSRDLPDLGKSASSVVRRSKAVAQFSTARSVITSLPQTSSSSERIALLRVCSSHKKWFTARSSREFLFAMTPIIFQIPTVDLPKRSLVLIW